MRPAPIIHISALAVALLAGLPTVGCKKHAPDAIAVIPAAATSDFWKSVHAGAEKAAAELGVRVLWQAPARDGDPEDQIKAVQGAAAAHVKGIVLGPADGRALVPAAAAAVRAGIPVIGIDERLESKDLLTTLVTTDHYRGGRLAGDHLVALVGGTGKAKVTMLRPAEGDPNVAYRQQGFLDAINFHTGVEVVPATPSAGLTTESAFAASEALLSTLKTPDGALTVQGIFCPTEATTFGMLRALEASNLAGKVAFVGYDASPRLIDAMAKGHLDATVVQDPINMGYLAVKATVDHLAGRPLPPRVDSGVMLITRATMGTPEAQALLYPDFKKWLKE
jgi:ribose transport system substrate-binding protein